jgi:hypothetical protein
VVPIRLAKSTCAGRFTEAAVATIPLRVIGSEMRDSGKVAKLTPFIHFDGFQKRGFEGATGKA